MNFSFTEDHKMITQMVKDFAEKKSDLMWENGMKNSISQRIYLKKQVNLD